MCVMSATAAAVGLLVAGTVIAVTVYNQNQANTQLADARGVNFTALMDPKGPNVQFILFTNGNKGFNLKVGDYQGFENSGFNITLPTKIIIHGYLSSIRDEVFYLMKDAYLSTGDYNIIGMDWSALCDFEYFSAMRGAQMAGDALTAFINFLIRTGVQYADIHVIGHSLGAHVAGTGADAIQGGKVGRITGLDPAGPGYGAMPPNLKLDPGDAQLVDVIHTYMRILSLAEPLGHVDFYPNGGRFQPGCPELLDIWKVPESINCNHGRAYVYFIESILNPRSFKAQKCANVQEAIYSRCFEESEVFMGHEETYTNGLYYVKTNLKPPFSLSA